MLLFINHQLTVIQCHKIQNDTNNMPRVTLSHQVLSDNIISRARTHPVDPWNQSGQDRRCRVSSTAERRRWGWTEVSLGMYCPASPACMPSLCIVESTCQGVYDRLGRLSAAHLPCWWQSPAATPHEYEDYTPTTLTFSIWNDII